MSWVVIFFSANFTLLPSIPPPSLSNQMGPKALLNDMDAQQNKIRDESSKSIQRWRARKTNGNMNSLVLFLWPETLGNYIGYTLVDRIQSKIRGWQVKYLLIAGRLTFFKAVTSSIPKLLFNPQI